jgi:hypothetical protein
LVQGKQIGKERTMKEKIREFEESFDRFMRKKILAQDAAYTAIFNFNEGLINYAECQGIVFNAFQEITGTMLTEFKASKFF